MTPVGLRERFERAIGLGVGDEPRRVEVQRRARRGADRPVVSTPGARIRMARTGRDGELARLLVLLHRRGIPVEIVDGPDMVTLDGAPITPAALFEHVRAGSPPR